MKKNLFPAASLAAAAAAALLLAGITSDAGRTSAVQEKKQAENSLRRAIVSCYALEGFYPENYEYIKKYYGVRIDEDKYFVHYDIFAANVMPDFGVYAK